MGRIAIASAFILCGHNNKIQEPAIIPLDNSYFRRSFRFISGYLHPLTFEYYSYTPPGKLSNLPILIYSLVMLNFSLKHSKNNQLMKNLLYLGFYWLELVQLSGFISMKS